MTMLQMSKKVFADYAGAIRLGMTLEPERFCEDWAKKEKLSNFDTVLLLRLFMNQLTKHTNKKRKLK
jgi:hypothetical protein